MDDVSIVSPTIEDRKKIIEFAKSNRYSYTVIHYAVKDYDETLDEVFDGLDSNDPDLRHSRWLHYLSKNLEFPFKAATESTENYLDCIKNIDVEKINSPEDLDEILYAVSNEVSVKSISGFDDRRGIIVEVRNGRKKRHYPLCTIEPSDYDSNNWELVRAYTNWQSDQEIY